MKIRPLFVALCAILLAQPTVSFAQSRMISPVPEGYVVAHEAENELQSIREEIPEGESLEQWTSMITTQRFAGVQVSALQYAQVVKNIFVQGCAVNSMSEPAEQVHQGYEAASFSATCYSAQPHGGPETFFLIAVRTPDAMLVRQVAFRDDATRENMMFAVGMLRSAVICEGECDAPAE